jgi:hypothetical protein
MMQRALGRNDGFMVVSLSKELVFPQKQREQRASVVNPT